MSDFASIMGGASDEMVGHIVGLADVAPDWDAYYRIQSSNVFLDRFASSGDSIVDASGNPGGVRIAVGNGADTILGGAGSDSIWAGGGNDVVWAGGQTNPAPAASLGDDLVGPGGNNTISGGAGHDLLIGGSGNDTLSGGLGMDTIRAGAGDDYIAGGSGADALSGGDGNDSISGGSGDDILQGQNGADSLIGGSGRDELIGGSGNDTLFGGTGGDVFAFDDGFGQDVIRDFGPGDQINLAADLNGTGIASAQDLVAMGMVSGGTTAAGTKFTVLTVGTDTIRLERVNHADFIDQIGDWVRVG